MSNGWKDLPNNARVGQMFRAAAFRAAPTVSVPATQYNAPTDDAQYRAGYKRGCDIRHRMTVDFGGSLPLPAEAFADSSSLNLTPFQRGYLAGLICPAENLAIGGQVFAE